jgi:hypothetical protein
MSIRNEDLEDAKFFNTYAHSGTQWNRDPTCWRYMDLWSLLAILNRERLHFTHISDLYRHDPHEGTGGSLINVVKYPITPSIVVSPPDPHFEELNRQEIESIKRELQIPLSERLPSIREKVKAWDHENNTIYISCWHTNEIDSDFMWRIYGRYEYGFAIRSSVQNLFNSIGDAGLDLSKLGAGFVVYPTRDQLIREKLEDSMGSCAAFMIKSPQYSPENEFRVFVKAKQRVASCDVRVDLRKLIHGIHISPLVPRWAVGPLSATLNPLCAAKGLPEVTAGLGSLRET